MPASCTALFGGLAAAMLWSTTLWAGGSESGTVEVLQASSSVASPVPVEGAFELTVGFAEILRIDGEVGTIVLGDPEIADASPLDARTVLLIGRTPGTTNLIVLDDASGILAELMLHVGSRQPRTVMVRRALVVQTYTCNMGLCEGSLVGAVPAPEPDEPTSE